MISSRRRELCAVPRFACQPESSSPLATRPPSRLFLQTSATGTRSSPPRSASRSRCAWRHPPACSRGSGPTATSRSTATPGPRPSRRRNNLAVALETMACVQAPSQCVIIYRQPLLPSASYNVAPDPGPPPSSTRLIPQALPHVTPATSSFPIIRLPTVSALALCQLHSSHSTLESHHPSHRISSLNRQYYCSAMVIRIDHLTCSYCRIVHHGHTGRSAMGRASISGLVGLCDGSGMRVCCMLELTLDSTLARS